MSGERELAEEAFAGLDSSTHVAERWPPVTERIREARRRKGLSDSEVADRVGITTDAYYDLEARDSEAFTVLSLAELARLGQALTVSPRALLFGEENVVHEGRTPFAEISRRLKDRLTKEGLAIDEFGDKVGWNIADLVRNPDALWDFNLVGVRDVCLAVDIDWVTAVPGEDVAPPVRSGGGSRSRLESE
jgi:DNA-binding XRE family transcriptional regulator